MNTIKYILLGFFLIMGITLTANKPPAKEKPVPTTGANTSNNLQLRFNCTRSTRSVDLKINNIQAKLQVGGDIWWDRTNGRYIVPRVPEGTSIPEVSSLYAGGVWIGGFDPGGNLKVGASTYGGGGVDYYPGPLDFETGLTEDGICQQWDQFFTVKGADVLKAVRDYEFAVENGQEYSIEDVPDGVKYWPGQGNIYFEDEYGFKLPETDAGLGNFWDQDDDKIYSPEKGDFPVIDIRGCEPASRKVAKELVPDEMIYWIYNDAGNTHGETNADLIRMEVQVQSFAYATNNEINDMTFYRFKLINRAREDIRDTYFAMWVDPDLGCATDDYSGCDIGRSLAYTYNADEIDGTAGENCGGTPTYGNSVPLVGTDYFRGPLAPKVISAEGDGDLHVVQGSDSWSPFDSIPGPDGINKAIEPGDSIYIRDPDIASGEASNFKFELGMSSCMIYYNGGQGGPDPLTTDPNTAEQYYQYMSARWLDGTPATVGGSGLNPGSTDFTNYVFSDPPNVAGGWSMWEERLSNLDTRTVQASGPFLLKPNAVNELIVGAVWVPDVDHPAPDLIKLTTADDIAQNLFDNCFDIIDGPDAPTVCPIALDQEIILVLNNDLLESNNRNEEYSEVDILSSMEIPEEDRTYVFEGYRIYQLINATVSTQELDDISKSRLVASVDRANGVAEMYNWTSSIDPNASVTGNSDFIWTPELANMGANDLGIENTFRITQDQFSADDPRLVNHKKYYYMAVAYAYNEYEKFNPNEWQTTQQRPYLEGRRNIRAYEVIPRPIVYRDLNASYGDGAVITRVEGVGTGGAFLDITDADRDAMLARYTDGAAGIEVAEFDGRITYKEGAGPMEVKIYNPLEVRDGRFELRILGDHIQGSTCAIDEGAVWQLTNLDDGTVIVESSDRTIDEINEQLIVEYGFSIKISQQSFAGSNEKENNGAVAAIEEFVVPNAEPWFRGVTDELSDVPAEVTGFASNLFDFIKNDSADPDPGAFRADPGRNYNMLGNGYWYPFQLTSSVNQVAAGFQIPYITPGWAEVSGGQNDVRDRNPLRNLNNVDIVLTSDKDKWSRCIVLESRNRDYGVTDMMDLRANPSVDKNGMSGTNEANYINGTGMSWFPGYVIDIETGKRLNIFFGENGSFDTNFGIERNDASLGNGADMLFNPTDREILTTTYGELLTTLQNDMDMRNIFLGGQHMIYVTRQEYDGCKSLREEWGNNVLDKAQYLKPVTWTSIAMMQPGKEILTYEEGVVPSDMIFKLRVDRPYNLETTFNIDIPTSGCFTVNDEFPVYEFEIVGKTPGEQDAETTLSSLDNINAVPNPYYAYSTYEPSQFDKVVKITNLPATATVTIYSLDGKFIKQFDRDEEVVPRGGANPGVLNSQVLPDLEWDLNNSAGIPIASGVYLIHVAVPGVGEKTIKWFGVNRKFDPAGL